MLKGATSFGFQVGEYCGQRVQDSKEKVLTDENLHKAEIDYLLSLGLTRDEFEIKKVVVDKEQNLHLNTIIVHTKLSQTTRSISDESAPKPTIVLIHGYGGTGLMFSCVIPALAYNFRVILIDLIGNGSSSRPKWDITNGFDADLF